MAQPLSEYFALEAGEFLEQMDALLAGSDRPDPVRFFRLARGVRGSAQLAGAAQIAEVAERLEDGARAIRDGVLQWTPEVRERARRTADDLRSLVERHGAWGAAEDERARRASERWADVQGGRRGNDPRGGDALFEFVRREIAGVVAEMDRALAELAAAPEGREPLRVVLRRMRPVRGVAGMEALAPVLEVLEGIEDAAHEVLGRSSEVTGPELELLAAGAAGLRAAASALERGQAPGESAELTAFRELRDRVEEASAAGDDAEVVPVTRLFADEPGAHLVSSPMAPVPGGEEEMTPEVEAFLRIEATGFLDRAEGLLAGQPARPRRFGRTAREVAELAASVRELAGTYGVAGLATAAELAANRLRAAGSPEEARDALQLLRYALPGAPLQPVPAAPAAAPSAVVETAEQVQAAASAGEGPRADEEGVVPVETLLYAPEDALREALALRGRIEQLAGGRGTPLGEAVDELFGLVQLGLAGRA